MQPDDHSGTYFLENDYSEGYNHYKSYSSLSPEHAASITPKNNLVLDKTIPVTPYEQIVPIEEDTIANFKNVKRSKRLNLDKV